MDLRLNLAWIDMASDELTWPQPLQPRQLPTPTDLNNTAPNPADSADNVEPLPPVFYW